LKTKVPNTTGSNHLYNTLELLMMMKHVEQAIRSAIETSVASSWHFYFHILRLMSC
jgi:hypothetical protein